MKLKMIIEESDKNQPWPASPDATGWVTQQRLLDLFEHLLILQNRKRQFYSEAWQDQGFMGNVARVLSKASRLKNMLWREFPIQDSEETIEDTLQDIILLGAFALFNYRDRNKWGS